MTSPALPSRRFGIIGSVTGLLVLIAAVLPHWVIPVIYPSPPIDQVIVETGHRLKERLAARAKGVEYQAPPSEKSQATRWNESLAIGAVSLGLLALVFAVCSLLFREEKPSRLPRLLRRSSRPISAALGVGAIAFELAIVAMGALILIVIVYLVLDHLSLF